MKLNKLRNECLKNEYPIMFDESLDEIVTTLDIMSEPALLELGSCVGYSAIYLATKSNVTIDSIEKDIERHTLARENVKEFNLTNRVNMIYDDALVYNPHKLYDVILFDAAKAQNEAFFERYFEYLKEDGILYVDNVEFHGFVENQEGLSARRNLAKMVRHISDFLKMLETRKDLKVKHLSLGDGLLKIRRV